jgi:hypothetical protein
MYYDMFMRYYNKIFERGYGIYLGEGPLWRKILGKFWGG